ncbi:uncharacterized protein LOC117336619 [Pecten maximus]|uniref:uncharacterized protein LOC117336619 n=1 Tax=Pecten maximus TaxID=6579 RepID=UPI001458E3D4|nr:uncharacterized protein LOC117336619 [Pecten maximus]
MHRNIPKNPLRNNSAKEPLGKDIARAMKKKHRTLTEINEENNRAEIDRMYKSEEQCQTPHKELQNRNDPIDKIPQLLEKEINNGFVNRKITEEEILNVLLNLNPTKPPGPDYMHPRALKETAETLTTPQCKTLSEGPLLLYKDTKNGQENVELMKARAEKDLGKCGTPEKYLTKDEAMKHLYDSLMDRLDKHEVSIRQLQTSVAEKEERIQTLETELEEAKQKPKEGLNSKTDKRRSASTTNVAFSTSMVHDVSVHEHETVIFGHVLLDVGLGYNNGDGVYIVPRSGVYVFTWSITSETNDGGNHDIHTSLMVNGSPVGAIDSDADKYDWGSATGVVVLSVDYGDHVFVQVITGSSGKIISNTETKSTFSGWLLF